MCDSVHASYSFSGEKSCRVAQKKNNGGGDVSRTVRDKGGGRFEVRGREKNVSVARVWVLMLLFPDYLGCRGNVMYVNNARGEDHRTHIAHPDR